MFVAYSAFVQQKHALLDYTFEACIIVNDCRTWQINNPIIPYMLQIALTTKFLILPTIHHDFFSKFNGVA